MKVYGICLSAGKSKKKIEMDTYKVYQFERGGYYVRGESSKCPHILNSIVSKENAISLADGSKIPIWKGDPATKKKREALKKRKALRKEKKKETEKAKKVKEKAKKVKEKAKKSSVKKPTKKTTKKTTKKL
jgi:hypothetical protein